MKKRTQRSRQFRFDDPIFSQKLEFGGELMKKAKNRHARPFAAKQPIHLILKSSKATGTNSFDHYKNLNKVNALVQKHCQKYGVKLLKFSNNGSHLHLLVKFISRSIYLRFIRSLTSKLVMAVTKTKKLAPLATLIDKKRFFDYRPFTRIIRGLKAYKIAASYIELNILEAEGEIPHRQGRLKDMKPEEQWMLQ